jgi:hypothetical protein
MMIIVIMLIYAISLALWLPSCVNILNLYPNTKLALSAYFGNGIIFPKLFDQQIDICTGMSACFEINATQDDFEGALLFKLQRCSGAQYNMDTSTTEVDKHETTHVHMLISWKVKDSKLSAYVVLVKHDKEFIWNEDNLKKLYYINHNLFKEYDDIVLDTWLMGDNIVLKTIFKAWRSKRNFELSISIYEEERSDCTMGPLYVDLKR